MKLKDNKLAKSTNLTNTNISAKASFTTKESKDINTKVKNPTTQNHKKGLSKSKYYNSNIISLQYKKLYFIIRP
jgi:hypothetical protein